MILAERAARLNVEAQASNAGALIALLKLEIEKLRREIYGSRSERKARLLDQLEMQLEGRCHLNLNSDARETFCLGD